MEPLWTSGTHSIPCRFHTTDTNQIDGLQQLCAALPIDAAGVYTHQIIPVFLRPLACVPYLPVAEVTTDFIFLWLAGPAISS